MTYLYVVLALAAGAALSLQLGVNNSLRDFLGSPVAATLVSFIVGTLFLLAYMIVMRTPLPAVSVVSKVPPWTLLGGALGAYYVVTAILVAPRLGAANLISLTIAAQIFTALVLDHFGLLGFTQHSINGWRIVGALLLIAGVVLIVKK